MTNRAQGTLDVVTSKSSGGLDDGRRPLMRVLLAGEPASGFTAIPGVASLPLTESRARWPVRLLLRTIRRCYCWSTAIVACTDADLFIGLDAPRWAKLVVAYRRLRRALSPPVWADNPGTARAAVRAAVDR
jgi:hypothetical protein